MHVNSTHGNTAGPGSGGDVGPLGTAVEPVRLAIVATHPIQYQSPWFREIARSELFHVKVFFLWDFGVEKRRDPTFGKVIAWDVPLLDGFDYEFVPNEATEKGNHSFWGLHNPELKNRVAQWGPDAVLLLAYRYRSVLEFLFKWRKNPVPLVFRGDSHRLFTQRTLLYKLRRFCIRTIFRNFAACLYVGSVNKEYFIEHGVDEKKLFFVPHAVERERFNPEDDESSEETPSVAFRRELGIPEEHRVALFVGKFEPKKAPLDLVDAFIDADLERVTLVFVGDGALREKIVERINGHEQIKIASFRNQKQMPAVYRAADVLILPSVGLGESWGLVLNEAMECGLAVIGSTGVGAGYDLLRDGENGYLFERGDVQGLTHCLKKLFSDSRLLDSFKKKSRECVEEYSFESATRGLHEACLEVLPRGQSDGSPTGHSGVCNYTNAM